MINNKIKSVYSFLNDSIQIGEEKKKYIYIGILLCLIAVATIISSGYSRDSTAYLKLLNYYGSTGWGALTSEMFHYEIFFLVASKLTCEIGLGPIPFFLMISVISLSIKFYLINEYSNDKLLSLAFFASYFFILHDSTQIRFGMGVAFVYLGLHFLAENRKFAFVGVVLFSAVMFHVSTLFFIIMLLFTREKSLYWLLGMIVVALALYPFNFNVIFLSTVEGVIQYFDISGTFLNKVHAYALRQEPMPLLGIFRPIMLLLYFCAFIIFQYRKQFNAYEMLCYNAFLLSIFFYIFLKDIVVLQVRFTDMFGFSLVFLIPFIHRALSCYMGKRNAYIILLSFFTAYLLKFTLYDKMLII